MTRLLLFSSLVTLLISSCSEKVFTDAENLYLDFSSDTILFDTVFSSLGTATRELRVFNTDRRKWLKIDRISLCGGEASPFRINIDGEPLSEIEDLELAPGDSLYIFIDILVNPLGDDNPVSIVDSVLF